MVNMRFLPTLAALTPRELRVEGAGVGDDLDVDIEISRWSRSVKPADVPAGASFEPNLTIDPLLFWQDDRAQCLASIETTARRGESTSGMPTSRFPIMSRLIRKVLAVQGSSAAPERLFSFTGLRLSK